ncbi:hypothetical protein BCR33DRAFT_731722 [Rhizoclosmatium globosum]|uniref:Uncharacterized protein n=1 Tax=Rhizoclosmatium globosum TaxID=329046 RepID=A0A1Y1ZTX2_9FUNG|nr:hypothetical protein BCR33DRAFT_731722 [Rhizoclosmatium globosum]|eukprot:ORY13668.1 hypothetical protein BCR33DRAFT_731722 [Rhizoclosmatium globosum]
MARTTQTARRTTNGPEFIAPPAPRAPIEELEQEPLDEPTDEPLLFSNHTSTSSNQPPPPSPPSPTFEPFFSIANESSTPLLRIETDFGAYILAVFVSQHETINVKLKAHSCVIKADIDSVLATVDDNPNPKRRIVAKHGMRIVFKDDPDTPPLTLEHFISIQKWLQKAIERSKDDRTPDRVWDNIATALNRPRPSLPTVYTFNGNTANIQCSTFSNWDGTMSLSGPYTPTIHNPPNFAQLLAPLLTSNNSTCYKEDLTTTWMQDYNQEWSSQEVLLHITLPWSPTTFHYFPSTYVSLFKTLALVNNRSLHRLPSTILWHIIDFVVQDAFSINPETGGRGILVWRLHQATVCSQLQKNVDAFPNNAISTHPTTQQKKLLNALDDSVGISRPILWNNYGLDLTEYGLENHEIPSRAGRDYASERKRYLWDGLWGSTYPIYLRWDV